MACVQGYRLRHWFCAEPVVAAQYVMPISWVAAENDRPLILGNSSALMAYGAERLLNSAWTSARHAVLSGRAETNAQNVGDPGEHSLTTRPMLFGAALLLAALQAFAH